MAKVEGKSVDLGGQHQDMEHEGHDTPEMNRRGTEKNTTSSITFSRYLTRQEMVMAKKMEASV